MLIVVVVLFFGGSIWLTWYLTRRQVTKADVPLPLTPASTTQTPTTKEETAAETKQDKEGVTIQLSARFNLISFGHRLAPSDCKNVFTNLSSRDAFALKQGKWVNCFSEQEWSAVPSEGYFVGSANGENLKVPSSATPVSTTERHSIDVAKGWNAFGNPFPRPFTWQLGQVEVKFSDKTMTYQEAIDRQHLSAAFRFNSIDQKFDQVQDGDTIPVSQGLLVQSGGKGTIIIPGPGE